MDALFSLLSGVAASAPVSDNDSKEEYVAELPDSKSEELALDPKLLINCDFADLITCAICFNVANNPVSGNLKRDAGECGHLFCQTCLHAWHSQCKKSGTATSCPTCRAVFYGYSTVPAIRRLIGNSHVKCSVSSECTWTGNISESFNHKSKECLYAEVSCRYSPNCPVRMRSLQLRHEECDCPFRTIECKDCGEQVEIDQMEAHRAHFCKESMLPCPHCQVEQETVLSDRLDATLIKTAELPDGRLLTLSTERLIPGLELVHRRFLKPLYKRYDLARHLRDDCLQSMERKCPMCPWTGSPDALTSHMLENTFEHTLTILSKNEKEQKRESEKTNLYLENIQAHFQRYTKPDWRRTLKKGDIVDALDTLSKWYLSSIKSITPTQLLISYNGWGTEFDQWYNINDEEIQPPFTHSHGQPD